MNCSLLKLCWCGGVCAMCSDSPCEVYARRLQHLSVCIKSDLYIPKAKQQQKSHFNGLMESSLGDGLVCKDHCEVMTSEIVLNNK